MNLNSLLVLLQCFGLGLIAVLIIKGRCEDRQLSSVQLAYREKSWEQYKLLSLTTLVSYCLNLWSAHQSHAWRLQHLGQCLSLAVFACACACLWLVVSVPLLLRRYNYIKR